MKSFTHRFQKDAQSKTLSGNCTATHSTLASRTGAMQSALRHENDGCADRPPAARTARPDAHPSG